MRLLVCGPPAAWRFEYETRRGEGNCKSTYIRSRKCRDRFAITLVFLARWRRGAGHVTTLSLFTISY